MELYLKKFFKLFTVCSSFLLTTCAAYDLGKDGTTYYKIDDPENATWDQVSFIVKDKCATCHTDEKPWYKPENTPEKANAENPNFGLNKIALREFWDKNNGLMSLVRQCIADVCGTEEIKVPMPPNYATPLDENEKTALLSFTSKYIPAATIELSETFQSKCAGCHGQNGDGKNGLTGNKAIGESQSDTFEKYKNTYKTITPMPTYSADYSDADALADWQKITGKTN